MASGIAKALALTAVISALAPVSYASDPFLQRAARQMERDEAPEEKATARPAAPKQQQTDPVDDGAAGPPENAPYYVNPSLSKAISHVESLIDVDDPDFGKLREAYATLKEARRRAGEVPDPRVEALIGELALIDGKPERALESVGTLLPGDIKSLTKDDLQALYKPSLIRGQALLETGVIAAKKALKEQPKQRTQAIGNDFFGIPLDDPAVADIKLPSAYLDLEYMGIPLASDSEKPSLSEEAASHIQESLVIFDHLAGTSFGVVDQSEAAFHCGRSLALLGRYDDAINAFDFAHHSLRAAHPSDLPDHLKRLARRIQVEKSKVAYLRDVSRYSLEYLLYRKAQEHRLHGRLKEAIAGYQQCVASAQETMTKLLIAKLSGDLNADTEAGRDKIKVEESPYTAASRLYEGLCLVELGRTAEGIKKLEAFVDQSDPKTPGLYRGEAMLQLARLHLDGRAGRIDRKKADDWLYRLDEWVILARAENEDWRFNDLLPGIRKAAKQKTDGPTQEKKRDMWGNVVESKIDPGMLVNRKTTQWYLDDLEEQCAKFRGFLLLADGHGEQALEQFRRITKLDQFAKDGEHGIDPNDFTRLKFGADHGYLIAYPQEQVVFNDNQRYVILLADLHYASSDFDEARGIYEAMLAGRYGRLTEQQKDYPRFAAGLCHYRSGDTGKAIARWEQVIEKSDGTYTEFRAAYAIGHLSRYASNPEVRQRGDSLLVQLARSKVNNDFTRKARITVAMELAKQGETKEAIRFLERVDDGNPATHQLAMYLVKNEGRINLPVAKPAEGQRDKKAPMKSHKVINLADLPDAKEATAVKEKPAEVEPATDTHGGQAEDDKKDVGLPKFFGI